MSRHKIDPYLLSDEENIILDKIRNSHTPLLISRDSGIPRSTVYFLLLKLEKRGFVEKQMVGKKKRWILQNSTLKEKSSEDPSIKIYKTAREIEDFLLHMTTEDKNRIKSLSGNNISNGWRKNVGNNSMIKFNNLIKKNGLISELITSSKYFEEQYNDLGEDWGHSFADRPCEFHFFPDRYINHSGQIFIKSDNVFLIDMNIPIIIEIKNKNISRMIQSMFEFIKDNTPTGDVNELIRKIMIKK